MSGQFFRADTVQRDQIGWLGQLETPNGGIKISSIIQQLKAQLEKSAKARSGHFNGLAAASKCDGAAEGERVFPARAPRKFPSHDLSAQRDRVRPWSKPGSNLAQPGDGGPNYRNMTFAGLGDSSRRSSETISKSCQQQLPTPSDFTACSVPRPERVYRAFLDADAMAKWLPPNGFTGKVHHMDAKVGGTYKMSFTNFTTGKSHSFGGTYLELVPHERIRYTDKFDDPNLPGEMQTTITLKKVSVRHRAEHRAGRRAGRHPGRGLLSRLAGIADPAREARRGRDSGLVEIARVRERDRRGTGRCRECPSH